MENGEALWSVGGALWGVMCLCRGVYCRILWWYRDEICLWHDSL